MNNICVWKEMVSRIMLISLFTSTFSMFFSIFTEYTYLWYYSHYSQVHSSHPFTCFFYFRRLWRLWRLTCPWRLCCVPTRLTVSCWSRTGCSFLCIYMKKLVSVPLFHIPVNIFKGAEHIFSIYWVFVHPFSQTMTAVTFNLPMASLLCPKTSHSVVVVSGCPFHKRLVAIYPRILSDQEVLYADPKDEDERSLLYNLVVIYDKCSVIWETF